MSTNTRIRPYLEEDQKEVIALWELVFPEEPSWNDPATLIDRKLSVQRELFLVATIEDELIGTVMAGFDGVRGWVHKMAVQPGMQRLGIASQLMREVEQRLRKLGCDKLNLQVRASNIAVVEFYTKAGYSIEDRVSMGKKLDA